MRLLLVEDDNDYISYIQMLVREDGSAMDSGIVRTLSEALEFMCHEPPTLVLLDLWLPDSRGHETIEAVRKDHPNLPIVVCTAANIKELGELAIRLGTSDHLIKGEFSAREFFEVISEAVSEVEKQSVAEWRMRHAMRKCDVQMDEAKDLLGG